MDHGTNRNRVPAGRAITVAALLVAAAAGGCRGLAGTGGAASGGKTAGNGKDARKEESLVKEHKSGEWSPELSSEEKDTLFAVARDTLEWSVNGRKGRFPLEGYKITPKLGEKCATFVTFKNNGRLRGCMGCLEAVEPMYASVHRSAANAARDFRFTFAPIAAPELPEIDIHVSLLSPRREIKGIEEFVIGRHGICLEKAGRSAVFLPEVAVEQKWSKEETLTELSLKAGLDPDAWREGCRFQVYESVGLSK